MLSLRCNGVCGKHLRNNPIWLDLSVICIFFSPLFPPRHWAWGIWGSRFLRAQSLRSIWLTWKQMCFHRSDSGFIAAPSKAWVQCVCLAKNNKKKKKKWKNEISRPLFDSQSRRKTAGAVAGSLRAVRQCIQCKVKRVRRAIWIWYVTYRKGSWLKSYKILIGDTSVTSCFRCTKHNSFFKQHKVWSAFFFFFLKLPFKHVASKIIILHFSDDICQFVLCVCACFARQ